MIWPTPQAQELMSARWVSLLCLMTNLWRTGSRRNSWLRWEMLLKFISNIPSFVNGRVYMLLRFEIMLFERTNNFKEGATCLTSLGTTLRLEFSIMSDFKFCSGFRLIFSHPPPQSLKQKDSNVSPTTFKSGVCCRLCNLMHIYRSLWSPSNASGSMCFNGWIKMYILCKRIRNLSMFATRWWNIVYIPGIP